ncbi:MAG: Sporulation kinase A [candidate division BRC1 bacterium ADurb.BinA364]|nr:MAG: Sporulation kinase A [candidate division BRC1 bacterium ADurb.BinA364]
MTTSTTESDSCAGASSRRPRLRLLSADSAALGGRLREALAGWFAGIDCASAADELAYSAGTPLEPCVVVADFRGGWGGGDFGDEELRLLGRVQARLPEASVVLLAPPLSQRVQRLVQQSGVRHLFNEPIDWEILAGHLREIAQRIAEAGGESRQRDAGLLEICQAMGSTLDQDSLLDKILRLMISDLMAHQGSILLFDRETDQLRMIASRGLPEEVARLGYMPRKGSIAEWVIDHDEPLLLHEKVREGETRFSSVAAARQIASSMCVPLRAKGAVQGTININRLAPSPHFTKDDLDRATILATQAAISIENSRLYEANLQAERLATVGQTVAGISHSMKSIVTSLRGGISICEQAQKMRNWDLLDKGWGLVQRNFQRISTMAMEMLEFSKYQREPIKKRFSLEPLAVEVFATASARAADKKIALSHAIGADAKTIEADQDQIFQGMLNLVENAIDAIPAEGAIRVSSRRVAAGGEERIPIALGERGGAVFIEIADNGPGIDPENQKKIFEPFFSTKGSKGTGLGLAVTNKMIQEHGGRIVLESAVGQGTKFTIVLPD